MNTSTPSLLCKSRARVPAKMNRKNHRQSLALAQQCQAWFQKPSARETSTRRIRWCVWTRNSGPIQELQALKLQGRLRAARWMTKPWVLGPSLIRWLSPHRTHSQTILRQWPVRGRLEQWGKLSTMILKRGSSNWPWASKSKTAIMRRRIRIKARRAHLWCAKTPSSPNKVAVETSRTYLSGHRKARSRSGTEIH